MSVAGKHMETYHIILRDIRYILYYTVFEFIACITSHNRIKILLDYKTVNC